jgi:ABC-type iron transport system FetAB ATPase subunit
MPASKPVRGRDGEHDPRTALRARNLCRPGLAPVSFTLHRGTCLAITGASGAGKTLLLRTLADLDPSAGDVLLAETSRQNFTAPQWRRHVVYVAGEAGWWADDVGAHFADRTAALPLLAALLLPEAAIDWPVMRLSTGERQRLALARAIVLAPNVLLLDEPTSGLDRDAGEAAEALLRHELARGAAIVLVTHDPDQAERLGDARLRMTNGVLAAVDGAADAAVGQP